MRRRSILTTVLAGVMSVMVFSGTVRAQAEIPKEVIEATVLSPAQEEAVKKFIAERLPGLSDKDAMKRSRDELLAPFRSAKVSVAFRQVYTTAAVPELTKLSESPDDLKVVNCLRIAGEIATSDATVILEKKLADPRPAVRFAAVNGLERTMSAMASRAPAMPAQRVETLVDKLGQVMTDPKNNSLEVIDAAERALIAAMNVTIGTVRPRAFQILSSSVAKVAQRFADEPTPPQVRIVLIRGGQTARDALGAIQNPLSGDNVKDAAALGGQLLGWTMCQLKGEHLAADDARQAAANVASVAENTIIFASQKAGIPPPAARKLGEDLAKGNDGEFIRNVPQVMEPLASGFKLPAGDFMKCKAPG
jgi:hypothetical protein